jgi:hypothetical protein
MSTSLTQSLAFLFGIVFVLHFWGSRQRLNPATRYNKGINADQRVEYTTQSPLLVNTDSPLSFHRFTRLIDISSRSSVLRTSNFATNQPVSCKTDSSKFTPDPIYLDLLGPDLDQDIFD